VRVGKRGRAAEGCSAILQATKLRWRHASPSNKRTAKIRGIGEPRKRSDLLDADAGALQVLRRYSVFDVAPAYANCQPHRTKQYRV